MHKLITDFMSTFYGYGNLQAPYWFIGMEEGCGPSWENDVIPRFKIWESRGRKMIDDAREYHFDLGIREFWEAPTGRQVKVQRTWRRLLETLLCAKGQEVSEENVRQLQANAFAMEGSDTCLLELLPLPSSSIKSFDYVRLENQDHAYFASRSKYRRYVLANRIPKIRELVLTHRPRHVVLYGTTYRKYWGQLVNSATWPEKGALIPNYQVGESSIWLVPHPCARVSQSVFIELGKKLRDIDQEQIGAE
ncbi:hypothetical protein [Rhodoferax fermentans]|nr:hypothetical protein [Rhodoferax fermentans]